MINTDLSVTQNRVNIPAILSWLSGAALLFLSIGGFALSYSALYEVALANGQGETLSYVWPLLIDAAIIIFSFSVLRSTLLGNSAKWPWALVVVFTCWTIVFNLVHADQTVTHINLYLFRLPLRYLVAIIPPVALVLAFETLISQLKNSISRQTVTESLAELVSRRDRLARNFGQFEAEIKSKGKILEDDLGQLEANYQDRQARLRADLDNLIGQIETKRQELQTMDRQQVVIIGDTDPKQMKPADRQPVIKRLLADNVPETEILDIFDISAKTLSRDIAAIGNGHKS